MQILNQSITSIFHLKHRRLRLLYESYKSKFTKRHERNYLNKNAVSRPSPREMIAKSVDSKLGMLNLEFARIKALFTGQSFLLGVLGNVFRTLIQKSEGVKMCQHGEKLDARRYISMLSRYGKAISKEAKSEQNLVNLFWTRFMQIVSEDDEEILKKLPNVRKNGKLIRATNRNELFQHSPPEFIAYNINPLQSFCNYLDYHKQLVHFPQQNDVSSADSSALFCKG